MSFLKQYEDQFIQFDGAMGTMLQRSGMKAGALPEELNLTHPDLIRSIHQAYVQAGAQIITTNTFQASELKLKRSTYSVEVVIEAGVRLAKEAGAPHVALDIGPLGQLMAPLGDLTFQRAYELFRQQVVAGVKAGADCILIETLSDLYEAKAAILAAKEHSDLPVFCTMTFQQDGRTFVGADPMTAVQVLQGLGVDALGINCSLGPEELLPLVNILTQYARIPLMVQPNAGLPLLKEDTTIFPVGPQTFGEYAAELARLGVKILGGCCGTSPEHIQAIGKAIQGLEYKAPEGKRVTCCTSGTRTVILDGATTVIGERLNPSGKKRLKEALRNQEIDYLLGEAIEQAQAGAQVLDVNVGLPELDEAVVLAQVVEAVQGVVDTPLQIDSVEPQAIEAAVRIYNGKPIINSINGKASSLKALLPIAKKYGAAFIALTLDDKGIPETAEERLTVAETILNEAIKHGIPREDIIVDCLVMTASAQQDLVKETLRAVPLVKERLGLKTSLGVSNVSFGLPNRPVINRTFFSAALGVGLDAAILDPLSEVMMDTVRAFRVIRGEDREAKAYIEAYQGKISQEKPRQESSKDLVSLIAEGRKKEVADQVRALLEEKKGLEIINGYFVPALDQVGREYEAGRLFLPQLLRAAEAVKAGLTLIKEASVQSSEVLEKGKILLATVQGDIHDIGKNIAKMLLENYGYQVIDLGKDVSPERVAEVAAAQQVPLVGLSALMTTTVKSMQLTIEAVKKAVPHCRVMVGGAVLTQSYADRIGADFYAEDGQAGIRFAKLVFEQSIAGEK